MEDVQACDVLEVLVTGSNDAGVGNCEALKVSFPALPNINTIQHLLSKTSRDRVKLTVTFMVSFINFNIISNLKLCSMLSSD